MLEVGVLLLFGFFDLILGLYILLYGKNTHARSLFGMFLVFIAFWIVGIVFSLPIYPGYTEESIMFFVRVAYMASTVFPFCVMSFFIIMGILFMRE